MLDRRAFMKSAGAGFAAALLPDGAEALDRAEAVFATACRRRSGGFAVALLSETGRLISTLDLPDRGHDVTRCPVTGRLVAFARRPGTFAVVLSPGGEGLATITSSEGRHFYGHGVFSADGRLLYATENDFENAVGMIGIYDASDGFARLGEFASGGIGPHDVLLAGDGRWLVAANGGIETHPDFGRAKLNLPTMQPNLAIIDRENGSLVAVHSLPADLRQLSVRHLAPGKDGRIWVSGQYEGPKSRLVPLVGFAGAGDPLEFVDLPDAVTARLDHYVAAMASRAGGEEIAVTSPSGNTAVVLDAEGRVLSVTGLTHVSGIAGFGDGFAMSSGDGVFSAGRHAEPRLPGIEFDNHLLLAG